MGEKTVHDREAKGYFPFIMQLVENAIYLDVCALGRPYDDQSFMRIEIETTAVQLIIVHVKAEKFKLYYSPVHVREIGSNPDPVTRGDLVALLNGLGKNAKPFIVPTVLEKRARVLIASGMGPADAFHVAHAEQVEAAFITCDDRLIKKCRSVGVHVWYGTPVEFCKKEGLI